MTAMYRQGDALERVLETQAEALRLMNEQLDKTEAAYGKNSREATELRTRINNMRAEMARTEAQVRQFYQRMDDAADGMQDSVVWSPSPISSANERSMSRSISSFTIFSSIMCVLLMIRLAKVSIFLIFAKQNDKKVMKITLLVVGRTVEKHYITAIDDYVGRTKHFTPFDMEVIPELKNTKSLSMEQQKEKEGELILKALQPGDVVVLLDEHGKEFRSVEFASWIERKMHTVNKRLVFIVGGPYGFSPKVYEAAHEKISLSKMTFSHQMIRLIFVEQLYRAFTILNNNPYHHE